MSSLAKKKKKSDKELIEIHSFIEEKHDGIYALRNKNKYNMKI